MNEAARNMSEDENCEGSEPTYDATDFDVSHSLSIKVEYYRSFEYTLNWTTPMSRRRSSRLKFPQKSPASDEDVALSRRGSQRGRRRPLRLEETPADESEGSDFIDFITSDPFAKEGSAREAVGILSYGLDKSNDESGSERSNSSIVSGPSALCCDYTDQLYSDLCSACHKLYQKAKISKTPIRSKHLDNDPKSLTCDQWVLMKRWKPKGQPDARRRLSCIQLDDGVVVRRGEQSSPCSRPHIFLKRNLRRANSMAENQKKKKKRRRRKTRTSSQGSPVAKQQRLQNNSLHQHTKTKAIVDNPNRSFSSVSDPRDQENPETEGCAKDGLTELVRSSAALKAPKTLKAPKAPKASASADVRAPRRAPQKTCEFRDLLVQLRGSSSMIVKETS